jgi:3-hydroxymyristoyl/3-hydroxydecanoyl-(acyl carrier protein) dehydratase
MSARHAARIRIERDHPALAGHFPGEPIVPGVVVLERLLDAAERALGHTLRVVGLAHVKFPSPLRPDEEARASFESDGARLSFEIEHDGRTIARGVFRLAEERAP